MTMKPIAYAASNGAVTILFEGTLGRGGLAKMGDIANYAMLAPTLAKVGFTAAFEPTTLVTTLAAAPPAATR